MNTINNQLTMLLYVHDKVFIESRNESIIKRYVCTKKV